MGEMGPEKRIMKFAVPHGPFRQAGETEAAAAEGLPASLKASDLMDFQNVL